MIHGIKQEFSRLLKGNKKTSSSFHIDLEFLFFGSEKINFENSSASFSENGLSIPFSEDHSRPKFSKTDLTIPLNFLERIYIFDNEKFGPAKDCQTTHHDMYLAVEVTSGGIAASGETFLENQFKDFLNAERTA